MSDLKGYENIKIQTNSLESIKKLTQIIEEITCGADDVKSIDVIVVDPPRKGLEPAFIDAAVKINPSRIVYVSCNPATLARDLAIFDEKGFKATEVQPVDLFPQTLHVECVVMLENVNK